MLDTPRASGFDPATFQTLLGAALPVSPKWAWMRAPWRAPEEPPSPPDSAAREPLPFASEDGIATDALPDPVRDGQRYAQAGRPSGRRGGGPPETPNQEMVRANYNSTLRRLAEIEPNNRHLSYIAPRDWRPTQRDLDRLQDELIRAKQRAPGAIDTQESGIGIGRFAFESLPSPLTGRFRRRPEDEVDFLGSRDGCHTCGTRNLGNEFRRFVADHQRPSRLNSAGEPQRIFPQCPACSYSQGGLISSAIRRGDK